MIRMLKSLQAWGSDDFSEVFKTEFSGLDIDVLPLQQGLSQGGYSDDADLGVMLLSAAEEARFLRVRVGVFYSSLIIGCQCADDPTTVESQPEYCEIQVDIDRDTAAATLRLSPV